MKPWYKRPLPIIATGVAALVFLGAATSNAPAQPTATPAVLEQAVQAATSPTVTAAEETQLSNDNHYTNVSGNTVHSPAYTPDNSIPAGASAQCRDGTYSFSQHHSGTCSHHGGVARWL